MFDLINDSSKFSFDKHLKLMGAQFRRTRN